MPKIITFRQKGNWSKTERFLRKAYTLDIDKLLKFYAEEGVRALRSATPKDTGKTANSWYYTINRNQNGISIVWSNSNDEGGVNVAVLIQYGHGTKNGGYVHGIDYINPAIRPIFEELANRVWREVTRE